MARATDEKALLNTILEMNEKTDAKMEKIDAHLSTLTSTAIKHQAVLEEHIRRTEANEKYIESVASRIKPLEMHVWMWGGAGKVLAVLTALAAIAGVILKAFKIM